MPGKIVQGMLIYRRRNFGDPKNYKKTIFFPRDPVLPRLPLCDVLLIEVFVRYPVASILGGILMKRRCAMYWNN